jgi:hypothetical protein
MDGKVDFSPFGRRSPEIGRRISDVDVFAYFHMK